jgi:hypothetical protein
MKFEMPGVERKNNKQTNMTQFLESNIPSFTTECELNREHTVITYAIFPIGKRN